MSLTIHHLPHFGLTFRLADDWDRSDNDDGSAAFCHPDTGAFIYFTKAWVTGEAAAEVSFKVQEQTNAASVRQNNPGLAVATQPRKMPNVKHDALLTEFEGEPAQSLPGQSGPVRMFMLSLQNPVNERASGAPLGVGLIEVFLIVPTAHYQQDPAPYLDLLANISTTPLKGTLQNGEMVVVINQVAAPQNMTANRATSRLPKPLLATTTARDPEIEKEISDLSHARAAYGAGCAFSLISLGLLRVPISLSAVFIIVMLCAAVGLWKSSRALDLSHLAWALTILLCIFASFLTCGYWVFQITMKIDTLKKS